MKVSICMIVRNEEEILPTAIESTAGLADEIIIVDTGSTDNTIAVAKQLGAVVLEDGDRRNKAQERNRSIEASTGDWVVILDADETIADPIGFRAFLENASNEAVYIRETFMEGDKPTLSFQQMRAWRRDAFRYRYRAHEVPLPVGAWPPVAYTAFVWEHRPVKGRTWKREHMIMLLLMDADENPGDSRPLYYLAREYMYMQAWQACIDKTREYLAVAGSSDNDRASAWGNLATCYLRLGDKEMTAQCLYMALSLEPDARDWYGWLAELYHGQGKHLQAAGLLRTAISLPRPSSGYINELWYAGAYIYDLLARCLWYAGQHNEGLPYARKALELDPENARLVDNLRWFTDGGS